MREWRDAGNERDVGDKGQHEGIKGMKEMRGVKE